jgi:hypothetical protein
MYPKKQGLHWLSVQFISSAQVIRALLPRRLLILVMPIVLESLLLACAGARLRGRFRQIQSITIEPVKPTVAIGTSLQFTPDRLSSVLDFRLDELGEILE